MKHTILTCINGAKIDLPGSMTVQQIQEICEQHHDINHVIYVEIGNPCRCQYCISQFGISPISGLSEIENSSLICDYHKRQISKELNQ